MYKRSVGGWAKHWDFILIDTICLQVSFFIAYFIRFHTFDVYSFRGVYRTSGFVLFFLSIVIDIILNTMHNVLRRSLWEEIRRTIIQCGAVFVTIVVLLFTSKDSDYVSRIVFYFTVGIYAVLSFFTRIIYKKILLAHKKNVKKREVLLVGDDVGITKALKAFEVHPEAGINVVGLVLVGSESSEKHNYNSIPIVADESSAGEYIRKEWIDEVYFAVCDYNLIPHKLISQCNEMAVTMHRQMFMDDDVKGVQWVDKIAKQPVLTTSIIVPRPRELFFKRIADIIAGFFLSIAALFVLLFVTPVIKSKSPGPVILKNERIGLHGKKYKMYTIRTMYMDADKRIKEWREKHPDEKPTISTDPRFIGNENGKTGIGARLRKLSIDDLPKGFNVLLGSMSLVGTRAPSIEEWERYEYRHRARLACKPGLTGLWQASGRSKTMSFEEATALDTDYIANWSLELDFKILFKTATLKQ